MKVQLVKIAVGAALVVTAALPAQAAQQYMRVCVQTEAYDLAKYDTDVIQTLFQVAEINNSSNTYTLQFRGNGFYIWGQSGFQPIWVPQTGHVKFLYFLRAVREAAGLRRPLNLAFDSSTKKVRWLNIDWNVDCPSK